MLKADVLKKEPTDIEVSLEIEGDKVELKPTLLNQKEEFFLKFLVANFKEVVIKGRISGAKIKVTRSNKVSPFWIPLTLSGVVIALIGTMLLTSDPNSQVFPLLDVFGTTLMVGPTLYLLLKPMRKSKFEYPKTL